MNNSLLILIALLVYIVVCFVLESIILTLFRVKTFGRAFWQTAVVNLASLGVVYLLWPVVSRMDIDEDKVFPLLPILFAATVFTEGVLLMFLNRLHHWGRMLLASVVMNTVSFVTFYVIFLFL